MGLNPIYVVSGEFMILFILDTVDLMSDHFCFFLSSDRPWGERSAPGAEVSKGTSPRAVDADMLDIDAL